MGGVLPGTKARAAGLVGLLLLLAPGSKLVGQRVELRDYKYSIFTSSLKCIGGQNEIRSTHSRVHSSHTFQLNKNIQLPAV